MAAIGSVLWGITACGADEPPEGDGSDGSGTAMGTTDGTGTGETGSGDTTGGSDTLDPDSTGGSGGADDELDASCPGVSLLPRSADTAEPGPWPVGVRTVELDGLRVEVWYPAVDPGAAAPVVYDVRESLPASEQAKISDEDNPWQACDCYRDLPVDDAHGPYPVVLFVHGTAGFRTQSLPHMVHWASRGFVVMAADHPGLWLADLLGSICGEPAVAQDIPADLATMLAAARGEIPGLEDLGDRIDAERIGASGHSAGGYAVERAGADAAVVIPMAARGVEAGAALRSSLVLGAMADAVVPYSSQLGGYETTPPRKRLVGIANTGHLAFSEMCALTNDTGASLIEIAQASGVCGVEFADALFQCDDAFVPDPDSWDVIHYASSAVLEEELHCEPRAAERLGEIAERFSAVGEFSEAL